MRPILPSAREKKRYVVFEVISEEPLENISSFYDAVNDKARQWFGELYAAKLRLYLFMEKWSKPKQRGIIKVNRKFTDMLKALFCLITELENKRVIIKSVAVSGTLKKASSSL